MRLISLDNFGTDGIIKIKEGDRCLYRFDAINKVYIVKYQNPNNYDDLYGLHPGFAIVQESFDERYKLGDMLQWSDEFFIKKIKDETLEDFPEYFI
jgi:hypothetical protein